jgi:hypothetical protein
MTSCFLLFLVSFDAQNKHLSLVTLQEKDAKMRKTNMRPFVQRRKQKGFVPVTVQFHRLPFFFCSFFLSLTPPYIRILVEWKMYIEREDEAASSCSHYYYHNNNNKSGEKLIREKEGEENTNTSITYTIRVYNSKVIARNHMK